MACLAYASGVREEAERVRAEVLERYGGEVVTLVVASTRLEPGDVVSQSNVCTREWVADLAPEGAVVSLADVLGREVGVATEKGAPLTQLTFRSSSDLADVPDGHVALSIPLTDKLGVPRGIGQGATLVAYAVTNEGTRLVSGEMTVLAAPVATALGSGGQLTLSLLPDDVAAVLTASASGDLRLVMPAGEATVVETQPPASVEDVAGQVDGGALEGEASGQDADEAAGAQAGEGDARAAEAAKNDGGGQDAEESATEGQAGSRKGGGAS
jgi:pilus assembly protein CpaB